MHDRAVAQLEKEATYAELSARLRQAEAALRERERDLGFVFETAPYGIFRSTPDGQLLRANPALAAILGFDSPEALVEATRREGIASLLWERPEERAELIERVLATDEWVAADVDMHRADGTPVMVTAWVRATRDADGNSVFLEGYIRDITERRATERRLRRLNAVLRAVGEVHHLFGRETRREGLLEGVSRALVASGGYDFVWIALVGEHGELLCGAGASAEGLLDAWRERWRDGRPPGCWLAARDSAEPVPLSRGSLPCSGCAVRAETGCAHGLGVALRHGGRTVGLMRIAGECALYSDPEERELLVALAADVASAIHELDVADERDRALADLRASEERYRTLVDNLDVGVFRTTVGPNARFLSANPASARMHGYDSVEAFLKCPVASMYADPAARAPLAEELLTKGAVRQKEVRLRRKDGSTFWGAMTARAVRDLDGQVLCFDGVMEDITERKLAQEAAEREYARLSAMIGGMEEGVVFADATHRIVEVNDFFCRFVRKDRDAILGRYLQDFHPPGVWERIQPCLERFAAEPHSPPVTIQRPLGNAHVMLRMQAIYRNGRYDGVLLNVIDVTELVTTRNALRYQATHDALTNVLNRKAVLDGLERELARADRDLTALSVIMLDLDRFKQINDTYGHAAGDAVLRETARRIVDGVRPYDMVGRYGGEEFVVVVPGASLPGVHGLAERIRQRISRAPVVAEGHVLPVGASLGTATRPPGSALGVDDLLRAADAAMYRAKARGGDQVECAAPEAAVTPAVGA